MSRESTSTNAAFTLIKEGMEVIDVNGKSLGHVDAVRFGDDNPRDDYHTETAPVPDETPVEQIAESVAEAFTGRDDIAEELRQRLLRYGYLHLDGGLLLRGDRYITPDQVARVHDDHVHLNIAADDVLTV
jgi:hypothetical protein